MIGFVGYAVRLGPKRAEDWSQQDIWGRDGRGVIKKGDKNKEEALEYANLKL